MKISAHETLLLNRKNMKFGNSTTQTTTTEAPVSKPESTIKALNTKAQNNIAFQGLRMSAQASKFISGLMLTVAIASSAVSTSCTEEEIVTKEPDKYFDASTTVNVTVNNDYSALMELIEALKLPAEELAKLNANFEAFYKDWLEDQKADAAFYESVVDYMMNDEIMQEKMYESLIAQGKTEKEALAELEKINEMIAKGQYKEALAEITKLLQGIAKSVDAIRNELKDILHVLVKHGIITEKQLDDYNKTFDKFYEDWKASEEKDDAFYEKVVNYMMNDETMQEKMYESLIAQGKTEEEANKILNEINAKIEKGEYQEALAEITKLLQGIAKSVDAIRNELKDILHVLVKHGIITEKQLDDYNKTFDKFYEDWKASEEKDDAFYEKVVNYMMNDETMQEKMYESLIAQGKTEEEANKILNEINAKIEKGEYQEALTEITKLLGSIDSTLGDILSEVKSLRIDIKDIIIRQDKQIGLMGAFYNQNEDRNEKLDSIIANQNILNEKADSIQNTINKLVEVANDPTRFNEIVSAIKIEGSEIQELFKMFGFDISATLREIERDQEKGQQVVIGQLNWIQAVAGKSYCENSKYMNKITEMISFLTKVVPNFNQNEIKEALNELKAIKEAIDKNTGAIEGNTEAVEDAASQINGGLTNVTNKIDEVLAKMDQMIADFGKYAKEAMRYKKYYAGKFDIALSNLGNIAELLKKSGSTQVQILEEIKAAEEHQKNALDYLEQSNKKQDKLIEIAQQIVNSGNGGMTIDEYKAYMEERDASNLAIFEEYMIESGYAELPGTTTKIKDLVEEIKNDKQNTNDYSNQLSTIIGLLYEIKNLDPTSPDYSGILNEISEKITEWKCNCECGNNASNNEGILGDLENKLG